MNLRVAVLASARTATIVAGMARDPYTLLATAAAVLHETYAELRAAGFTQDEALDYLVKLGRKES